jgi:IS30 family transposase
LHPPEVADRLVPSHWESDLIIGANNRSAVATMVERTSRYVILAKLDAPTAEAATIAIIREVSRMAPSRLKTMTHDQGGEMACHSADPHGPWQRGSNKNTNGLLRQYMSKGTDLSSQPGPTGGNYRLTELSVTPDSGLKITGRSTG